MGENHWHAGITAITIRNFKGIGDDPVTVPLRPITLLFGKNSAGKSTVLQAMLYALEVLRTGKSDIDRVRLGGESMDLGGFRSVVHQHDTTRKIRISFDLDTTNVRFGTLYPIDEFLHDLPNGSRVNLEDMGTEASKVRLSLSIAAEGVVEYKVDVDGRRLGRIFRQADGLWLLSVNLQHDILGWPAECPLGTWGAFGPVDAFIPEFQNEIQGLYVSGRREDGGVSNEGMADANTRGAREPFPKPGPRDATIDSRVLRDRSEFVHGSMTRAICGHERDGGGPTLPFALTIGVLVATGDLAVQGIQFVDLHGPTDGDAWTEDKKPELEANWRTKLWDDQPLQMRNAHSVIPALTDTLDLEPFGAGKAGIESDLDAVPSAEQRRFAMRLLTRLFAVPIAALIETLEATRYLGPIRAVPPRALTAPMSEDDADWASGMAAWYALLRATPPTADPSDGFIDKVNAALDELLALGCAVRREDVVELDVHGDTLARLRLLVARFEDSERQEATALLGEIESLPTVRRLSLHDGRQHVDVAPCDVGMGISQVIPVVVGALAPGAEGARGGIFAVEQPELHVHPAVQCGLGDVFIRGMRETGRLMLIETHSEHLILRLLRRIRETGEKELPTSKLALCPDDVAVYYVEATQDGMRITSLSVTPDGDFATQWPQGFFEERAGELF